MCFYILSYFGFEFTLKNFAFWLRQIFDFRAQLYFIYFSIGLHPMLLYFANWLRRIFDFVAFTEFLKFKWYKTKSAWNSSTFIINMDYYFLFQNSRNLRCQFRPDSVLRFLRSRTNMRCKRDFRMRKYFFWWCRLVYKNI